MFIVLFSAAGALPSPGEKVARRAGCGMRAATYDAVLVSDFLMHYAFLSLKTLQNNHTSARIPHQSAARASHADSFSPGEAMAACGRCRPQWGDNDSSIGTINENLEYGRATFFLAYCTVSCYNTGYKIGGIIWRSYISSMVPWDPVKRPRR